MINILSVDDKPMNHKVLELDLEDFMEENKFEYEFHSADDGLQAIKKIKTIKPDVIFMDMMMPYITGAETIKCIKCLDDIGDPKIITVTALGDSDMIKIAKQSGANAFITKPFKFEAIDMLLSKYLNISNDIKDDFNDLDDEDFFDFDDEEEEEEFLHENNIELLSSMDEFNKSHLKVSAKELLKDYSQMEIDNILEDIQAIQEDIQEITFSLHEVNLNNKKSDIANCLHIFADFLNNFDDFKKLATSINHLIEHFEEADYTQYDIKRKEHISLFIKAILTDLYNWKQHVFEIQDAVDVYYINASMLNSCIQLEDLLI
ncbi:MAG: response regulator [Campylobacterota bacterium]|nr:response regulator [Campylobacterota bacterium]